VAVAMVLVGLGLQLVLAWTAQRDIGAVLTERSEAMVTVIQQASGTALTVPPDAVEPGVQVYDADGGLVAGTVERDAREVAKDLSTTTTVRAESGPEGEERLLGTPFTTPSGESGVLVVSQETAAYERSEFYAGIATVVLGVLVVAGTGLIALRVTKQALAPVAQMAERAADWSEHDLEHRFELGAPSNELAALGETLDHLLDRVASAILAEQRLTSELAHELRTPLTAIKASADLALMRGVEDAEARQDFEQISQSAKEMSTVITTLLDLARAASSRGEQTATVAEVVRALTPPADVPLVLEVDASTARVAAPVDLVVRAVAPVLDNAMRHCVSGVTITATDHPDHVALVVADDGPGVPVELRETIFAPGVSHRPGGAGLGLGIAQRVARSFGGRIELDEDTAPGAAFRVVLPRR
jgi:two-component system, OmpR family, sensor kinase